MSLFPNEDVLTKEIESWRTFTNNLNSEEYREIFDKMLSDCYRYANAINAKGESFPTDSLLISLLLSQQKMIDWLSSRVYYKQQESLDHEYSDLTSIKICKYTMYNGKQLNIVLVK